MRISRDKSNKIAKAAFEAIKEVEDIEFIEDPQTIRQEGIDKAARAKIESQKRTIIEGTAEWDILYRKYYNEEVKKLGI
jgi:hypothetical protein